MLSALDHQHFVPGLGTYSALWEEASLGDISGDGYSLGCLGISTTWGVIHRVIAWRQAHQTPCYDRSSTDDFLRHLS